MTTILVVDDDPIMASLLARAVAALGQTEVFHQGRAVLERLGQPPRPDLILLDALMPDLDGFAVCQQIKGNPAWADIPVIFVTGQDDSTTETRALAEGAADFITKPLIFPSVRARVKTQLTLLAQRAQLREANAQLQKNVAERESTLLALLRTVPDPIWFCNTAGDVLMANPAACAAFGPGPEIDGVMQPFADDFMRFSAQHDAEVRATGKTHSQAYETCDPASGKTVYWEIVRTPLEPLADGVGGVIAIARDLTQHKENEQQLRKHFQAVEQNPNAIIITDRQRTIEYVNTAFTDLTGYTLSESLGRRAGFIGSGRTPAKTYAALHSALLAGQAWSGRFYNQTKDGREIIEFAHVSPIRDADGEITHFLSIQEDITVEIELEEAVTQARTEKAAAEAASDAKSSFLANMSHEIRTPMNAILGLTHLLQDEKMTPQQGERLEKIERAARHLHSLINNILDISKIEAGRLVLDPVDFRLPDVVDRVRAMVAETLAAKDLTFEVDLSGTPELLHGDVTRLTQILLNYIGNAVRFTERGGICLKAHVLEPGIDSLLVRFEIRDTGIGMTQEALGRLFRAFEQADNSTTRKYGGTGLGLHINRQLAQLMGGEAGAESELGRGSCFWVTLRLAPCQHPVEVAKPARSARELAREIARLHGGVRVLLAEDNLINQEVSLSLLRNAGLDVDLAPDGQHAVDAVRAQVYGLILLDLQMPRLDGCEAAEQIRQVDGYAETPIVAMTANAFAEDRQRCLASGMNDHLPKPVDPVDLYTLLLRWLPPGNTGAVPLPVLVRNEPSSAAEAVRQGAHPFSDIPELDFTLGLKQMSQNLAVYEQLLGHFATNAGQDLAGLEALLAEHDFVKARRHLHTLKGSAGTLGAMDLRARAASLEDLLRNPEQQPAIQSGIEELRSAYMNLAKAITKAGSKSGIIWIR